MQIYRPATFHKLRKQLGVDDTAFRVSLEATKAIGNPGASGSQLFITDDSKYIVKTMEGNEYIFVLNILDKYVKHLTEMGSVRLSTRVANLPPRPFQSEHALTRPASGLQSVGSSLLVKYVGMFAIKKNRKIRLIVMVNRTLTPLASTLLATVWLVVMG